MLSHYNYLAATSYVDLKGDLNITPQDVYLSYLPLPHVMERLVMYALIARGAQICFYSGDVQKIKDDLALVKPTIFLSVPRLFSRFYDAIKAKLSQAEGLQRVIVDRAIDVKTENVTTYGNVNHAIYDKLVFSKTREALGGRVRIMMSGSAPLLPHIHSFMKVITCAPLMEGYGQTESTGASFATKSEDPTTGHVGGPSVIPAI